MTTDALKAKPEMEENGYTCVVRKGEDCRFSFAHGIKPLLEWIDEGNNFAGYGAADQVVGKAAALLYIHLGVKELYGKLLSEPAAAILEQYGVTYAYENKVPYIINRKKDGMCPMEQSVLETSDPTEAVTLLKNTLASLKPPISGTAAKAADRYAIDVMGIPSLELMERASAHVADHIRKNCPGAGVLIISGMGNNGADGVCIGRMLKESGFDPTILCCGSLWKGTWEFYHQLSEYRRIGGKILPVCGTCDDLPEADVLVDAVFGIGLKRKAEGEYFDLITKMNGHRGLKLSVDVPSGINADTGEKMGTYFIADRTFTFGRNKTGLTSGDGAAAAGKITVCEIGIPEEAYARIMDACLG